MYVLKLFGLKIILRLLNKSTKNKTMQYLSYKGVADTIFEVIEMRCEPGTLDTEI